ncbi:MAG: redoxin family protein [Phycisphaerales bacterium]|nr:redoxin family protein [Phycisphaerales bacterium]
MRFRGTICAAAAMLVMAGAPAMAQKAQPKPERAPGVSVERVGKLMVGDRAPELSIASWVKGEPVTGFEDGKVYVVECWATWCGPCIAGMPHVSELQKEYKDKGVTVIGVNIWDDPKNVEPFMTKKGGNDRMQYTVAVEEKIEGKDIQNGKIAENWMAAAGQNGIPTAFIVDQSGYIAWIGHPMELDKPLEEVVAGKWDIAKAAKNFVDNIKSEKVQQEMMAAFQSGNMEQATKLASELMDGAGWDNPGLLNFVAWSISDPEAKIEHRDTKLAIKAAERAAELTDNKEASILDTLAWAYYQAGMKDKAIATETKAAELAPDNQKEQFKASLEQMKK